MKIKELPENVRLKLQSGLVITDAVQCVLELVYNSLDAEATAVAAIVDLVKYKIQVIDNGKGIEKSDVELVGERYMTSKYETKNYSSSTYGSKGMALSSILDVCKKLTIETKIEDGPCFVKTFENNKVISVEENNSKKDGSGTTVTVFDFLCTMPVRRRRISEVFDTEEMKNQLQYLAIIHNEVSFTLRNENKNLILLKKNSTTTLLQSISQIFNNEITEFLKPINFQDKKFEISGFVSCKQQSQSLQLLYINKRIITRGIIHKFINNILKEYFADVDDESSSDKVFKKMKKKNNVFVIEIKCSQHLYEIFNNLRKTTVEFKNWKEVLKCVHKAIRRVFKLNDSSSKSDFGSSVSNDEVEEKSLKKLGVSFLNNVVKGAPANRVLCDKVDSDVKIRKRKSPDADVNFLKPRDKIIKSSLEIQRNKSKLNDCTSDSLESPIPKKGLKKLTNFKPEENQMSLINPNESFLQFYEWLKSKFEKDSAAFNLYNEFLKVKETEKKVGKEKSIVFKSPVVAGKLKNVKSANKQQLKRKTESFLVAPEQRMSHKNETKVLVKSKQDYEIMNSIQQKNYTSTVCFNSCHQTKMEDFQKPSGTKVSTSVSSNIFLKLKRHTKTPVVTPEQKRIVSHNSKSKVLLKNKEDCEIINCVQQKPSKVCFPSSYYSQIEVFQKGGFSKMSSSVSSDIFLKNLIGFRNKTENINCNFTQVQTYQDLSQTQTWASHYLENSLKNYNNSDGNLKSKKKVSEFYYCSVKYQNAEMQTSFSDDMSSKINAAVQTSFNTSDKIIQNSFSLEDNFDLNEKQVSFIETSYTVNNISQEVPYPDFWNLSPEKIEEKEEGNFNKKEESAGRQISSNDLICGQESNTKSQYSSSTSKETRTLAAMMTDCLEEIGSENKNSESLNQNSDQGQLKSIVLGDEKIILLKENGSSVENNRLQENKSEPEKLSGSESTQLPKTIPIEDIQNTLPDSTESCFYLTERHDFVPKGLSPKFFESDAYKNLVLSPNEQNRIKFVIDNTEKDLLESIKWQDECTGGSSKPNIPDGILDEMQLKAERNLIYDENKILSASLSYCAVKVHKLLHSFTFTKELLSDVKILGQLDKKFIVAKIEISIPKKMTLISLFDQHAVDERIKLEELLNEYLTSDGKLISSSTNPYIICELKESIIRAIPDFVEKLNNFGIFLNITDEKTVEIQEIPKFLRDRYEKNIKVKNKSSDALISLVQTLITNVVSEASEGRGAVTKVPNIIHNAFCSEACSRAIKFNKHLTTENMVEMINKLNNCKLPFQCAHGRPSVIPIIDLEDFEMVEDDGVNYNSLKQFLSKRNKNNGNSEDF